jgi:hypothetical protein
MTIRKCANPGITIDGTHYNDCAAISRRGLSIT